MKTNKPLFRFIHATDLHFDAGLNPSTPEANARIACLINDINVLHAEEPIDFVILSGDLTDSGSAIRSELSEAKRFLDRLDVPYYTVAGNHDLAPHRGIAVNYPGREDYYEGTIETSNYARVFGAEGLRFSFRKNGYHFAGVSLRDEDPDGALDWLEQTIDSLPDKCIVTSHYGLYPPREAGALHEWGFARIGNILSRLQSIINRSDGRVIAYLYGHNHINSVIQKNGVYHISGGGIQKGCTGYRLFNGYNDQIESSFRLLSDTALLNFNYWGIQNPERCMDAGHSTVEKYHRGNREEQQLILKR